MCPNSYIETLGYVNSHFQQSEIERVTPERATKISNDLEATTCNLVKEDNHLQNDKIYVFNDNFGEVVATQPKS